MRKLELRWAWIGVGLVVLAVGTARAGLLGSRKRVCFLQIAKAASYQLQAGDHVDVMVTSGIAEDQITETIVRRIRVVKIADMSESRVLLSLMMTPDQHRELQTSRQKTRAAISLRIVRKESRAAPAPAPSEGLEDLDFEKSRDIAQKE